MVGKTQNILKCLKYINENDNWFSNRKRKHQQEQKMFMNESDYRKRSQEVLYSSEYILSKIFRKDGPILGVEFDSLPSNPFPDARESRHEEKRRAGRKRRKVSKQYPITDYQACFERMSAPRRHGIGKGSMTAMLAPTNRHGMGKGLMTRKGAPVKRHGMGKGLITRNSFPSGTDFGDKTIQKRAKRVQQKQTILTQLANRAKSKKKACQRSRKVECQKLQKQKPPLKERCELALEAVKCLEYRDQFSMLVDDEELELSESLAGPNPLNCSVHFPISGKHGCSLCKDLLPKFPSNSVTMKQPLSTQPWSSSPDLVKKLFKAYHFICTYAATVGIYSFTFDEFAQAFHEKDSLLLGRVHLALVRLLLRDIKEHTRGFLLLGNKNCRFLGLLHSLENRGFVLEFWQKSLNLLTWTEILRQLLIAAGYGSKLSTTLDQSCNKEVNLVEKYGLTPGSLKGELFRILLAHGNNGMKVSDLAKDPSIVELNLEDGDNLITSTLSGDITLFEKISCSGYRLRIHEVANESEDRQSDSEDSGSIDNSAEVTGERDADQNSDFESGIQRDTCQSESTLLTVYNEIDESHQGEPWLLGLMEGEYSDLSIGEKLYTLTSLIDLVSAGSSINLEDPMVSSTECPPNISRYGSGAKIKRSVAKSSNSLGLLDRCGGLTDTNLSEQPIDSLVPMSKTVDEENHTNTKIVTEETEKENYLHPMQSIFLGSDRRYNRYWLFLGPCDEFDPGHRRIYFESSEDGHWEIIDTREALCALLVSLDQRGAREARLRASLEKREAILTSCMMGGGNRQFDHSDPSEVPTIRENSLSPISDVDNRSGSNVVQVDGLSNGSAVVERGKKVVQAEKSAFDAWIWKSFYFELNSVKSGKKSHLDSLKRCDHCQDLYWKDEKHCRICHTTFELNFDLEERYAVHIAVCRANMDANKSRKQNNLSSQLQSLKAAIYAIESVIPDDALVGSWKKSTQNLWVNRLRRVSSLTQFLQVLGDFVNAVYEDWFYQSNSLGSCSELEEIFSRFSSMPQTYSAVALWLVQLDALVASLLSK